MQVFRICIGVSLDLRLLKYVLLGELYSLFMYSLFLT